MPDREKVISTLEEIKTQTAGIGLDSAVIAHGFIDKVIALLKEQPEIVRCKDCKHCYYASNRTPEEQSHVCDKIGMDVMPDWFCADGKRKEGR